MSGDLVGRLILHAVWQGCLVAVVVRAAHPALDDCSPKVRARVYGTGLLAMPVATLTTAALLLLAPPTVAHGQPPGWLWAIANAWTVGVLLGVARLLLAWRTSRRLRRFSVRADIAIQELVAHLAKGMGAWRVPPVLESVDVCAPMLVGLWQPCLLVPLGLVAELPRRQLELILRHELGHLVRLDPIINALQSCVETIYFFHPAVWWLSAQLRHERERACDELAVESTGDRLALARALTDLAARHQPLATAALSITGGSLMQRIHRLLHPVHGRLRARTLALPLSLMLVATAGIAGMACDPSSPYVVEPRAGIYADAVEEARARHGVPAEMLIAMIAVESNFDPHAESPVGARGLMQLMPQTANEMGVEDVWDPAQNIAGGAAYLRLMLDRYDGDEQLAIAAYNAGPHAVDEAGGIPENGETPNYVRAVLARYANLRG